MFKIALKSTLARKRRLLGTALSVIIGVAFLAGTLVFTDTIKRTFDDLFADVFAGTDSYVRSETTVDLGMGNEQRGRIPDSVINNVRGIDGVADAQGVVQGFAQIVGSDGEAIGDPGRGAPTFAMSFVSGSMSPWKLTEGSRPPGPGELLIDQGSAEDGGLHVGDTVTVLDQTGRHEFPLVGTARFGTVDSPGGASVAVFDLATAQQVLLAGADEVDAVMVQAVEGVSEQQLTARLAAQMPTGIEVLTGTEITHEAQNSIEEGLGFFNTFLLVFATIGLVVACFTIYNTFQIIITQRTREMALLRSLGATRSQVMGAQLFEAVVIGLAASIIGLFAGVGVAALLKAVLGALGIDIPAGGTVFAGRTAIVALLVGTGVTIVSAVFPARRASRVPPIAAIRDVDVDQSARSLRGLLSGSVMTVVGLGAFVAGLAGSGIEWVGIGALAVFVGVFTLGPLIARPVTRAIGAPLPTVAGVTGSLARQNAMRNPKRTARTGGALMVGVALVVGITVIAASVKDWTRDIFDQSFTGDFVVSTDTFGFGGLSPEMAAQLGQLSEIEASTGIRAGAARDVDAGSDTAYLSIDPVTASTLFDVGLIEGSMESLTADGILIDDDKAAERDLGLGDQITFGFVNGTTRVLTIEGIYTDHDLAGPFVVTHALHEQSGTDQFDFSVYISKAPGVSDADARAAIATVSDQYPNADLESRSEYVDAQAAQIDPLVNLMYALLGLAVIIALINIANSMSLSIHERTRELGLLRAVGMTRHQIRAAIGWESVLIGLLGTGLGVLIGVFFGWAISVTVRDAGLATFTLPLPNLVVITVAAVLGGLLAAGRPARRAARLDVLRAIATE